MSDRTSYQRKLMAEGLAPYGKNDQGPHTKLSISLSTELVELLRASAEANGLSVSATVAASLRRSLHDAEQANLERALAAQAQENLDWAEAFLPTTTKLWSDLEWAVPDAYHSSSDQSLVVVGRYASAQSRFS